MRSEQNIPIGYQMGSGFEEGISQGLPRGHKGPGFLMKTDFSKAVEDIQRCANIRILSGIWILGERYLDRNDVGFGIREAVFSRFMGYVQCSSFKTSKIRIGFVNSECNQCFENSVCTVKPLKSEISVNPIKCFEA